MRALFFYVILLSVFLSVTAFKAKEWTVTSPDKNITVRLSFSDNKSVRYTVQHQGTEVLTSSALGILMEDENFIRDLKLKSVSGVKKIADAYEMVQGKKQNYLYTANEQTFHFVNRSGKSMDIIFRISNDGVAFRYFFPGEKTVVKKIKQEATSFHFVPGTKAFLQPMSEAKTGWAKVNPCYEEYYKKGIDAGTPSPTKAGWVYPALFNTGKYWVLITEADLTRNYCGTRLAQHSPDNEYAIGFPEATEVFPGGIVNPESTLPWYTPWRVLTIGTLKTIAESSLGTDLASPAVTMDKSFIKPGQASWSWALLKDDSIVYDVQKRFVDYAADMKWEYCLIDVNWDTKIGYDKIKELAAYAKTKNVGLILWYNSSGDWNETAYTPKSKLLAQKDRVSEFKRLKEMGIKGVKIDFFGGDGQSMIQYYLDILDDAAAYGLLVNFHGSTIPRGWHRTYPHLMSMEAIKGFEYVTFEQTSADEEPSHCAMLPFTRNAFDPMDFTPMCLYKIPRIERRTTSGFELALSVLFLSGIQHFAETPQGMTQVPSYVKDFIRTLPQQWQDTRFVTGYPGKEVVIARKYDKTWYVAGINGENSAKKITIDLSFIGKDKKGYMITDGAEASSFQRKALEGFNGTMEVNLEKHGGFVIVLE